MSFTLLPMPLQYHGEAMGANEMPLEFNIDERSWAVLNFHGNVFYLALLRRIYDVGMGCYGTD